MAADTISSEPGPCESLRIFGAVLQGFRERADLTQEAFARRVRYSVHFVASVEQGRRLPPARFVERAEEALDAFGILQKAAHRVTRQPGLAAWFRKWASLEEQAVTLHTYECRVVPGLLQTEAYAKAVSWCVPPLPTPEEMEERVAARLARQRLLSVDRQPAASFSFILEQSVLERRTGGHEVAREAIDRLLDLNERHWNVELQLMPLRQPTHSGLDGPLRLLEAQDHQWFAYSEGQQAGLLISDRKDISVLQQRYAKLRSQALTPEDSVGLLRQMRGAL
ncbi:helix-turn-helix transcriptional regulator [Streptomyces sp. NPDC050703]|uniref:helix-turn-helix domain-containing protein n=1 Tax=Streptomyces sp. NPDC050703 TaxID=3157218 RepID=UPI00343C05B7